jgi:hypothetical protein
VYYHRIANGWNASPLVLLPTAKRFCFDRTLGDLCRSETDYEEVRKTAVVLK